MDAELHFGMPAASRNYKDDGDESSQGDAIPTGSWQRWAPTELERFDLETSYVDGYEC